MDLEFAISLLGGPTRAVHPLYAWHIEGTRTRLEIDFTPGLDPTSASSDSVAPGRFYSTRFHVTGTIETAVEYYQTYLRAYRGEVKSLAEDPGYDETLILGWIDGNQSFEAEGVREALDRDLSSFSVMGALSHAVEQGSQNSLGSICPILTPREVMILYSDYSQRIFYVAMEHGAPTDLSYVYALTRELEQYADKHKAPTGPTMWDHLEGIE